MMRVVFCVVLGVAVGGWAGCAAPESRLGDGNGTGAVANPDAGPDVGGDTAGGCQSGCEVAGETRCTAEGRVETCQDLHGDGCLHWGGAVDCAADHVCEERRCVARCQDSCNVAGARQCLGDAVQTCKDHDSNGCLSWGGDVVCTAGTVCKAGACGTECARGNECTAPGATQCAGDALVECVDGDGDGCLSWTEPEPCPAGQGCSNGGCATTCSDECTIVDARQCAGTGAFVTCGQHDADSCLEWGPATSCANTEVCSGGFCAKECASECTVSGAKKCNGNAVQACGDDNLDGCLEWGTAVPCGGAEVCANGHCALSCSDECDVVGAKACEANAVKTCGDLNGDGCLEWGTPVACGPDQSCSGGQCAVVCENECSADGAKKCQGEAVQVCGDTDADPCLEWGTATPCEAGQVCSNGACALQCENECTSIGAPACEGGGVKTCKDAGAGCLEWSVPVACPAGETCSGGVCASTCQDECSADGAVKCVGDAVSECGDVDADPCLEWGTPVACGSGKVCAAGECATSCVDECGPAGSVACEGGGVVSCDQHDADSCLEWGTPTPCPAGETCSAGSCDVECTSECSTSGDTQCSSNGVQTCGQYDADSCLEWGTAVGCGSSSECIAGACEAVTCGGCPGATQWGPAAVCVDGDCQQPTLANCGQAGFVDVVPFTHSYATDNGWDLSGDMSTPVGGCPGMSYSYGDGAEERFYVFQAPADDAYAFGLSPEFDGVVYVLDTCTYDNDASCLGGAYVPNGDSGAVKLELSAGQAVTVVVDGASGVWDTGEYKLTVHETCIPSCAGQDCGTDGCGGSCGYCDADEQCKQGVCHAVTAEDTCGNATLVTSVPWETSGYWYTMDKAVLQMSGQCPGADGGGGYGTEQVFEFVAPYTGEFRFRNATHSGSGYMSFYIVKDCENLGSSCLGGKTGFINKLVLDLEEGETVFVVADRYQDSIELTGFDVSITGCQTDCSGLECGPDPGCGYSCGVCPGGQLCDADGQCTESAMGETCESARVVDSVPFTAWSSTEGAADDHSLDICFADLTMFAGDGAGAPDHVYAITPPQSGRYDVTVTLGNQFHALVVLSRGCTDVPNQCTEMANPNCGTSFPDCDVEFSEIMLADETWSLFVDGDSNGDAGGYVVDVTQACASQCGDRVCGSDPCILTCGTCPGGTQCSAEGQCDPAGWLMINEVDYDQPSADTLEFVEIVNAGQASADLVGVTLDVMNGDGDSVLTTWTLTDSGVSTLGIGGRLVIGNAGVEAMLPDGVPFIETAKGFLQNGGPQGDAVRLRLDGQNLDAVSWEAKVSGASEGTSHAGTDNGSGSLGRCPDGTDTNDNAADFSLNATPTPGAVNACD